MDARETWQALQTRLTNARAAVEAGDRARALAEIAGALEIDPDFLAAQSLLDRILAAPDPAPSPVSAPATSYEIPHAVVPADGYAKFEQRAKRRRVDRRLDAARAALEGGRLKAAATALDEIIELDPNMPELSQLTAKFDELRRQAAETHRGPRFVAAAVFVVTVLAASLLHESTSLISRPMNFAAPLVAAQAPAATVPLDMTVVRTTSTYEPVIEPDLPPRVVEPAAAVVEPPAAARPPDEPEIVLPPPAVVPAAHPAVSVQEVAAVAISMPPEDDNQLIKQALQRYRAAYEDLDAQSAHAVWPAVDQAALARAFDGLESQSLTFERCVLRLQGDSASATCEGQARYIPKIGSREPRTEPRVWNFSLHKAGGDWKIESARAER